MFMDLYDDNWKINNLIFAKYLALFSSVKLKYFH